ncbi:NADH dehydrogenase [ubiquinone] 1 beta subcomplex subunit 10-like [Haliotis asinina]|uniref:NADH dehydrogenase [ubiquinone] 1 beta subcomplex subunit 10-like n=1 Tax=Haliotis asinina TaxID=109174 RepID=UPI0035319C06
MADDNAPPFAKVAMGVFKIIDAPVTLFREKFVIPNQEKSTHKWYHRRFRRVPSFDECDVDDPICMYEAEEQYRRDKLVDNQILKILRQRKIECLAWEGPDASRKCKKVSEDYETSATNWFIKYGDIGASATGIDAYMKQKHRLIWERRKAAREEA